MRYSNFGDYTVTEPEIIGTYIISVCKVLRKGKIKYKVIDCYRAGTFSYRRACWAYGGTVMSLRVNRNYKVGSLVNLKRALSYIKSKP